MLQPKDLRRTPTLASPPRWATYIGGKARRWRPKSDKAVVIGIRQRNGDLRLIHAEGAKSATAREIINANIGGYVEVIMTDRIRNLPVGARQEAKELA